MSSPSAAPVPFQQGAYANWSDSATDNTAIGATNTTAASGYPAYTGYPQQNHLNNYPQSGGVAYDYQNSYDQGQMAGSPSQDPYMANTQGTSMTGNHDRGHHYAGHGHATGHNTGHSAPSQSHSRRHKRR